MKQRLTEQAKQWLEKNPGRQLSKWFLPNENGPFIFKGDFYHKGVNLGADQVLNIQADHIFNDAQNWSNQWNQNPDNPFVRFAGIEYLGPVDGEWWEDKGKRWDRSRYHKFGGNGQAYILSF